MGDYTDAMFVLKTPASETDDFDLWTSEQLSSYIAKIGLKKYCNSIVEHKITGKLAPLLSDADLKELGIKCIGDRLRFRVLIDQLKRKVHQTKSRCIWVGTERVFHNRHEATCCTMCGICPVDPSTYTLMSNYLKIKHVNPWRIGPIRLCCFNEYSISNIDLTYVSDVDVLGMPAPVCERILCCSKGKDLVSIEIRGYHTDQGYSHTMILKEGEGEKVAGMIMNCVESCQMMDRE